MSKLIVKGPTKLKGNYQPVGNKNSVLKLIPTSILFSGDYTLTNVPGISDVEIMLKILEEMGASVIYDKAHSKVTINTNNLNTSDVPKDLARKLRSSVSFIGPLLARFGKVSSIFPGGDKIGPRELKAHFESLAQLDVQFSGNEWGEFELNTKELNGETVFLYEPSVTATENIILAVATKTSPTKIVGAACEPHVQELCSFLVDAGVEIKGIGSNVLEIVGKKELHAIKEHRIWTDYLDVCTGIIAAAITNSSIDITDVREEDLVTIRFFYQQLGLNWESLGEGRIRVNAAQKLTVKDPNWARIKGIYSQAWYGFPSDLMSITIVLAMAVKGNTLFFEKLYPDRMSFVNYFNAAGGNIITCDPHRIVVNGPTVLNGFNYLAPDLRAGMAYFLAALASNGRSEIWGAEHIDRGYPDTLTRFTNLGANIELIS